MTMTTTMKLGKPRPARRAAYSVAEAAAMLGVCRHTVVSKLRTVYVGDRRLVPATEIDRVLGEDGPAAAAAGRAAEGDDARAP